MSRRLFERQTSSTGLEQNQPTSVDRPIHELWLQSDNKKKTSETTKIQERDVPSAFQGLLPSLPSINVRRPAEEEAPSTDTSISTLSDRSMSTPSVNQPTYADILNLSPNVSSPGSIQSQEDDQQDNTLLNQLQVRRARPEHSPSDLSPNFSPSFSPRFVPQSRPRTLLAYLQNFGQNPTLADQTLANSTTQQQPNRPPTTEDTRRSAGSFFSRIFGNNPPTPPQNSFSFNNQQNINANTNVDEAVPTSNELAPYQQQQQVTNTVNGFPGSAIIVRTVQPGPNGSIIVNMRVLSLDEVVQNQNTTENSDVGSPELFGTLMNILAGLQGVNILTFGNISDLLSGQRGLDKTTIDNLPAVTYDEEAFKNVEPESKKCTICLEQFEEGNEVKYLWCLHRFHTGCVDKWLDKHSSCPVCKKDYSESQDITE